MFECLRASCLRKSNQIRTCCWTNHNMLRQSINSIFISMRHKLQKVYIYIYSKWIRTNSYSVSLGPGPTIEMVILSIIFCLDHVNAHCLIIEGMKRTIQENLIRKYFESNIRTKETLHSQIHPNSAQRPTKLLCSSFVRVLVLLLPFCWWCLGKLKCERKSMKYSHCSHWCFVSGEILWNAFAFAKLCTYCI